MSSFPLTALNFCSDEYLKAGLVDSYKGYLDDTCTITPPVNTIITLIKLTTNGIELTQIRRGNSATANQYTVPSGYYVYQTKTSSGIIDRTRCSDATNSIISTTPFASTYNNKTQQYGKSILYLPYDQFSDGSKSYQENYFGNFKQFRPINQTIYAFNS